MREASVPGSFLREMHASLDTDRMAADDICLDELADRGEMLFEHEFSFTDGLGSRAAAKAPVGPFRRVHNGAFGGPETISCTSCHWIGGPNGAGAETDNVFLTGDGARPDKGDARNPPALMGLGVVEALAREMTRDLQQQRDELPRKQGKAEVRLQSKGVDFGVLRINDKGELNLASVHGVDDDLIVKPFKGTLAHIGGSHPTPCKYTSVSRAISCSRVPSPR
jgi:hypothetical protein